jgi:lysophospholipase L1-like esterase
MSRNIVCYLILAVLLAACVPAAAKARVVVPSPTVSQTAPPTLELPSATPVPQVTVMVTSSCEKITLKIMPLGDSITYGDGIVSYGGYRNLLGALLTSDGYVFDFVGSQKSGEDALADADNEGHPGWRILNIKDAIDSEGWLETYKPDIILLHIGSNDLRYGNEAYVPDRLSALLDDILARLPETHIIVAQIIRTRWGSDLKHRFYNDAIPEIVAAKGSHVSVINMQDVLSKGDFTTLYHPSPEGYDKMAHAWESAILALNLGGQCAAVP